MRRLREAEVQESPLVKEVLCDPLASLSFDLQREVFEG
jgi:hypothetical protein